MKMNKKLPKWLMISGIVLLGCSISATAAAALNYYSENYIAQMDVKSIGVTLNENDNAVSYRDYKHSNDEWNETTGSLLSNMLLDAGDDQLILNKRYKEELSVTNSGTIREYVRATVSHYWVSKDNNGEWVKRTDLDPDDIVIVYAKDSGWIMDNNAKTKEKDVFYYNKPLEPEETSAKLTDYIYVKGEIAYKVKEETTSESYTDSKGVTHKRSSTVSTYDYDGTSIVLKADVDAVQTHNAEDAMISAWGIHPTIDDQGRITEIKE